eukprot:TRINITY_DN33409_c1_g1_i1.p1 TRINITY_DN33409_c1_g1~~TRINITY_DN33409_c1_g1_i1.p1  ORF type:complete len:102 (+),score=5.08 TRINITY_DN33409_c1_g1_i1:854-1159(+)
MIIIQISKINGTTTHADVDGPWLHCRWKFRFSVCKDFIHVNTISSVGLLVLEVHHVKEAVLKRFGLSFWSTFGCCVYHECEQLITVIHSGCNYEVENTSLG